MDVFHLSFFQESPATMRGFGLNETIDIYGACGETTVTIQLLTDDYKSETSWKLTDFAGNVQASGSNYTNNT